MTTIQSLDPRVSRLGISTDTPDDSHKEALDQFETFEVFLQPKDGRPYEHAGTVHAPNLDMAFLFGKEQYSRRFTCVAMAVAATRSISTTAISDNKENIYHQIKESTSANNADSRFEVFHLYKRGQHVKHMGSVPAKDHQEALKAAKVAFNDEKKPVLCVWLVKANDIHFVDQEDKDIWLTLSEKLYRDALAYKAGDKLNDFKEKRAASLA